MGHRIEVQLEAPLESGASPGGTFYMERGGEGTPGSGHGLKPQDFSGVITMRISCVGSEPTSIPRPRAWVGHQCMTLIWEEALPRCSGWMRRMRPVLLGGQRPQMLALRFFFLKRSIRENRKSIHLFLSLVLWIEHYFVPMPFIEIHRQT